MRFIKLAPCLSCLLLLSACATEGEFKLPGVYRIDVQQGNIIDQDMLDQLKPGMDQNQVRFIMGTPILVDPFHTDRWDYVFTYSHGGRQREQRHVIIFFKNGKLDHVGGDVIVAERKPVDVDPKAEQNSVEVPLNNDRPGFFSRLFNALPFVGEEKPRRKTQTQDGEESTASAPGTAANQESTPPATGTAPAQPAETAPDTGDGSTPSGTGTPEQPAPAEPLPAPDEDLPPAEGTSRPGDEPQGDTDSGNADPDTGDGDSGQDSNFPDDPGTEPQ